jgi:CIC family chloride channel protein
MGTAFAGIVRTPMTSVIMIFELTRDYTIIVPLMISNLIAYFISYQLQREPIYEALAHQDGVHLPTEEARANAARVQVNRVMRSVSVVLSPGATVEDALAEVKGEPNFSDVAWPVADGAGLCGMIRGGELEREVSRAGGDRKLRDLLRQSPADPSAHELPHVHPDHSLSLALERMGSSGQMVLPVVSRANVRQLLGVVVLDDILDAYGVSRPRESGEREKQPDV